MQNFLDISSVVDSVRSNAGSAFKSVQANFEEQALKAAGLGEDEEVLYRLNKHAQTYLRAADALQAAATVLADDFAAAMEDLAMREIARKFRDANKHTMAQQLGALNRDLAEPVRQACDADDYGTRRKLINKAFVGLLDVNRECFNAASASIGEAHKSIQTALKKDIAKSPPAAEVAFRPPVSAPAAQAPSAPDAPLRSAARRATCPEVRKPAAAFEDLLGGMNSGMTTSSTTTQPTAKASMDLLDFDFAGPSTTTGASFPPERAASSPNVTFDFDFDACNVSSGGSGYGAPRARAATCVPPSTNSLSLDGMSWPSKEDEDESCIKARVETWQQGKNLRTMLVSLHEVAPASSGWVAVQLGDVVQPADVKSVYRKAVLAVHPDKCGKAGEKVLGTCVFEALRDQWNIHRSG